jgi:alpha-D-ribose 1-methylphosphonate 5-triphosphate synthase subunit PhnH
MRLDPVHDLQKTFRKILSAQASPGTLADLSEEAELLDLDIAFNKGILLVALALLDAETSFCVASPDSSAQARTISQMSYARSAYPDEADFIFILGGGGAAEAIAAAKAGTLVDPHLGATIIIEAQYLSAEGSLLLSGPGIESTARLGVGLEGGWVEARRAKNVEFPLGVDIILVDASSRLASLPRTTLIREES